MEGMSVQRWIERVQAKLSPAKSFLVTLTVPAGLRPLFWSHQRIANDRLMKAAWQTIASLAQREPKPIGISEAHAVLHTHNRKRDDHPHARLIVAAGASHLQKKTG
jgi:hypothetical protein